MAKTVAELENKHLQALNSEFTWTDELRCCITGSVQFGSLDSRHQHTNRELPIVAAIGINYTQGGIEAASRLVPYESSKDKPGTVRATGSYHAAATAIAAFKRNRAAWLGTFASNAQAADAVGDDFILLMTNLSPFVTKLRWQEQARRTPATCRYLLERWPNTGYLNELFGAVCASTALWIGHSSIYGTDWVRPEFLRLMERWNVTNWLLTPNLNGMATQLHFKRAFAKPGHPLFPLFRP